MNKPLALGVLGCAGVTDYAILDPARQEGNLIVRAVASRSAERARDWADRRGIEESFGSYDSLLAAGGFDAIYIPLPNALHHSWAILAMRMGYPVICEKPMASNAAQTAEMIAVSIECGVPLIEAMHWRHHPLAERVAGIVSSGEIGPVQSIEMRFQIPPAFVPDDNIRRDFALGGGALMDQGCYCVDFARFVTETEPFAVASAKAKTQVTQIDEAMEADLLFPGGVTARIDVSMAAERDDLYCEARIIGAQGVLTVAQPFLPHLGSCLRVQSSGILYEETPSQTSSYVYQLRAISAFLRTKERGWFAPPHNALATMAAIDAIYRKSGLHIRC